MVSFRPLRPSPRQLDEFRTLGVDFISLHDGQDTTTPQGKLLFSIMAGLAEFYSDILSENVQDGMARAKAQGKHLPTST